MRLKHRIHAYPLIDRDTGRLVGGRVKIPNGTIARPANLVRRTGPAILVYVNKHGFDYLAYVLPEELAK